MNWTQEFEHNLNWRTFAPLNLAQLESEDEVTATMKDAPWRFGIEHQVDWTMENAGVWTEEEGMKVWRLAVRAEGTLSWSFYLSRFVVPKGGELFVWNEDRTDYLGSFNHLNVKEWEGLALSLIEGAGAVIEYREPLGLDVGGEIAVGQVVQGYRSLLRREAELTAENASYGPFGNSGACNINVNCPEGDDWQVENQSVALIVSGGFAACSGAMVNNTANDGTPYFLTANHCLGSPNSWTYYFNHESATCSGSTGPTNNSISGGTLLVADGGSDVALIELSSTPPVAWGVEYAGWDDPAKLICDFFCQVEIPVPFIFLEFAIETLNFLAKEKRDFSERTMLLLPAIKIKWCCLLLNEFLSSEEKRRRFAEQLNSPQRLTTQLRKANAVLDDARRLAEAH